jgi:hypothetical protein
VSALDERMFGKAWWAQPLAARYASIDAHAVGLAVRVEVARRAGVNDMASCITWRGTSEQFAATKTFPRGVFAKSRTGRYVYPGLLRGTVYPDGGATYLFVIEHCGCRGKAYFKKCAQEALTDENYLNFRDAVMAGFPLADLQVIPSEGAT